MEKILKQIKQKQIGSEKFIIVVDGRGGSGKSTVAREIENQLKEAVIIELDAYQLVSADLFNKENIKVEFNIDFENREFNEDEILKLITKSSKKIFILEGCFSFKNLSKIKHDMYIWVDIEKQIAANRLNKREKSERTDVSAQVIELSTRKYQEAEDRYLKEFNPISKADYIYMSS